MYLRFTFILFLITITSAAWSQSSKENSSRDIDATEAYYPQRKYAPEKETSITGITATYNAEKKYQKQLAEVAKQKRRAERELMKPHNTNPLYFGHKFKPKKHKPGKMKYCKVCGIRH